jgi:hypothetical protein
MAGFCWLCTCMYTGAFADHYCSPCRGWGVKPTPCAEITLVDRYCPRHLRAVYAVAVRPSLLGPAVGEGLFAAMGDTADVCDEKNVNTYKLEPSTHAQCIRKAMPVFGQPTTDKKGKVQRDRICFYGGVVVAAGMAADAEANQEYMAAFPIPNQLSILNAYRVRGAGAMANDCRTHDHYRYNAAIGFEVMDHKWLGPPLGPLDGLLEGWHDVEIGKGSKKKTARHKGLITLALVATQDIFEGEEIFVDYGAAYWRDFEAAAAAADTDYWNGLLKYGGIDLGGGIEGSILGVEGPDEEED